MRHAKLGHSAALLGPFDPVLLFALALALVFSLYGIRWGRVECWNRDDMAMRGISGLRPGTYEKPPFHTYLNHVLVIWPLDAVEAVGTSLAGEKVNLNETKLLQSRLIVVGMYLATIALAYWIGHQCFGKNAARIIALLFATSAGFIEYDHFLSCDSPLLLWMLLAFFFAHRVALHGDAVSYALAGFFTGIATATKYNGLVVGIAIPVAHLFGSYLRHHPERRIPPRDVQITRTASSTLLRSARNDRRWGARNFVLAMFMVPVGFIAGAPAAPFQWRKFITDFAYNAKVTPHYAGQASGHGYIDFLGRFPEILGWPGMCLIAAGATISLGIVLWRRQPRTPSTICFALAASVWVLYFSYIGSFPRMETRFVLPAIPFLILMAGPLFQTLSARPAWTLACLSPLFVYNAICSLSIGYRLNDDPRLAAQRWIEQRAATGSHLVIESSGTSPRWLKLAAVRGIERELAHPAKRRTPTGNVLDLRLPEVNGRSELFGRIFGNESWVQRYARRTEGDPNMRLFTRSELAKRNPEVIAVHSADYEVPIPRVRNYYHDLLSGNAGYEIALDAVTTRPPRWVYPRHIDFLPGRMTLLTRQTKEPSSHLPAAPDQADGDRGQQQRY